jgi:signal transduction histidine kinase
MKSSKVSQRRQRSGKLWLPSLLLLAQFLTITPVLLIVFADEQQSRASDGYVGLLDGLDRLSFAIAELESPAADSAAWRQKYSDYRGEMNRVLSASAPAPQIRETLARVDSMVERKDGRAARSELLNAQRSVRSQLSTTGHNIARKATYLKALVAGACLLAFGVVFVVRRFRVDAAIQRTLQQELRTVNEEVVAALAAARSESEVKNQFLAHVGQLMRTPSVESLNNLADQLADYSKMESGRLELQSIEFEPASIVTDVLRDFGPAADRKGLRLRSSIQQGLPSVVKGDSERLRQVLVNLMSNAVRFTQRGEILLRVEETAGAEERTSLRFEVRDTGSGIAEQGTGLGLAISKKLVELMGGKIDVASQPGRGSTLSFTAAFESVRASREPQPESSQTVGTLPPVSPKPQPKKKHRRERRAEDRHGTNYPTLLRAESAGIAVIRVLDVSASGLRVSVPFRLIPRTEVEIRIEGTSVVGIVRNCTCISANEFHVGIQIPREATADEQERLNHLSLLRIIRVVPSDTELAEKGAR